jgi:hypothetical protein
MAASSTSSELPVRLRRELCQPPVHLVRVDFEVGLRAEALEIYARVQKCVSRKNVHAAFDELLNGANTDPVRSPF